MARLALRTLILLGSAAIGLLVAAAVVPDMTLRASGFVVAVVVFALAQSLLTPLVTRLSTRYAPAFLGGAGLVSTFLALVLASVLTDGLRIVGAGAWALATLVVWAATALAAVALPLVLPRGRGAGGRRSATTPAGTEAEPR
ncbi:phage holin family protein [Cellulomonas sp. zg-ZUI222]|uniref:Phage holin family protein n=1 Tax=Cellulomonas wangleii TaxID=2816956 RepID=A0ABX8D0R4_9CELL|nr:MULTISPECIES: phage holin family protein [Cellulomonas]MBO0900031.1 phage holin family protein [Cellulomonas sp. zg-ZUI22]MBO0921054.1 phage holin family protein [Cellulomonas wangleii]MBO0925464.1 phage holin family protein [Cellulomonas wangleii]QVI61063.1 phage holin family protein [Cellulomonas wangleii]